MKMFSFSGLVFLIDTVILGVFYYKLRSAKKKDPENKIVNIFLPTILILTSSYLVFTVAILFYNQNPFLFSWLKIIGDAFLYLSFSFGIKIPFVMKYPKINPKIPFVALLIITFLSIMLNIFMLPRPLLNDAGIIYWNLNPVSSWTLYIGALMMWVPTSFIFFSTGLKAPKRERSHYFFMGTAFFMISVSGPLMVAVRYDSLVVLSQILMTIGFINLFAGMFVNKK
ncbi:TPA: hypothetical protein DDW69_02395 [candidate division CPR2 bacterium]|uniref:Histidine kinase N-terminal 7TM region domain-containing protein n=1 Tax=candidate division CPR2 bacterium GW2011_GWC1_41_48 TaxID=1618344 RepID=A0A0G0YJZ9_UNCC2|nr:MAG: hypothetical protein UT47_C0001G0281 [candidate division CPR2 bacterium GW2011_GWC2_39_35]KKR29162.1 MAG: hypothetical protein UT60_C0006G0025 [candidate division CPR2 bacterium GW2011_GWD2_39_7]KKS09876.1 MAG: hypothetical protein UU65_C0001G0281 [candidate division CPR2 bacterium GW2011_GWC1_41_48]OGB70652.1 MAG: hypothetical protein A2Y26_01490 [candidate division CPR2 bacterium GWD2_39_7]HBG81670.1 hypothetical protein [candidate division CPR2 bacterium]